MAANTRQNERNRQAALRVSSNQENECLAAPKDYAQKHRGSIQVKPRSNGDSSAPAHARAQNQTILQFHQHNPVLDLKLRQDHPVLVTEFQRLDETTGNPPHFVAEM